MELALVIIVVWVIGSVALSKWEEYANAQVHRRHHGGSNHDRRPDRLR